MQKNNQSQIQASVLFCKEHARCNKVNFQYGKFSNQILINYYRYIPKLIEYIYIKCV